MSNQHQSKPLTPPSQNSNSGDTSQISQPPLEWHDYVETASNYEISLRFSSEINTIISKYSDLQSQYCFLFIMNSEGGIGSFDLDQVFNALPSLNPDKEKSILLTIVSNGGSIEPAYQISKLCRSFTSNKFIVSIPRKAKSAATLLSLGADQIHMGSLSQLGPIDPQLGDLPALGVSQALISLASLAQDYPGSSEMFARYLRMALTVEQIGYCERLPKSAVQYATRLLETKPIMVGKAESIAKDLVYEYKHHGFVIDYDEAREHLGSEWIILNSKEVSFAEEIYRLYDYVSLFLRIRVSKYIWWVGSSNKTILIMDLPK